jgi:hypothetical protein
MKNEIATPFGLAMTTDDVKIFNAHPLPNPPLLETVSQYDLPNRHTQYVVGAQFIEPYWWA